MNKLDTLFVGQHFLDLPDAASTNALALEAVSKSKPPEGTVISTFQQTDGRGQIGSDWESEPGKNLSLSFIFYPDFLPAPSQFLLSQAVSLAVHDFAASSLPAGLRIKWPNDLYIFDRKVAGILIQNTLSGSRMAASVVGIGVNVNQEVFRSDAPNPTSFKLETGHDYDLYELIGTLCRFLERRYLELKSGKIVPLRQAYTERLYRLGESAPFRRISGEIFTGTITGTTDSGRLMVQTELGEETFDLKEISFCPCKRQIYLATSRTTPPINLALTGGSLDNDNPHPYHRRRTAHWAGD